MDMVSARAQAYFKITSVGKDATVVLKLSAKYEIIPLMEDITNKTFKITIISESFIIEPIPYTIIDSTDDGLLTILL
jgi:hypothetical protein